MKEKSVKAEVVKKPRKKKVKTVTRPEAGLWVNGNSGERIRMWLPTKLISAFIRDFGVMQIPDETPLADWLKERGVENPY